MTTSPRRLAREALEVARQALPAYACLTSRHDFTPPQRFAILVLKTFLTIDSRGGVNWPRGAGNAWMLTPEESHVRHHPSPPTPSRLKPAGLSPTGRRRCSAARRLVRQR
ncbi:MAG TPA: hypothetical protein VNK04_14955 [Gemmataceae bacterium]|nr:hypothetical protein [Gemmataceae bacterium]